MTVISKPNIVIRKPDGISAPLVDIEKCGCDEERVTVYPLTPVKMSSRGLLFMSLLALLMAVIGISCGLTLYRHYLSTNGVSRYQGFCTIPIPKDVREAQAEELNDYQSREQRVMPLQWSPKMDPIQFIAPDDDDEMLRSLLKEEFDIGNDVERIKVNDNGRTISFIHDFSENATGIVDIDRCFLMPLDLDSVLTPSVLLVGISTKSSFDVSRVHTTVNAIVPAIEMHKRFRDLFEKMHECLDKPVYQLHKNEGPVIRKRSADAPHHDYIHFAGKHVQEIEIANMAEILDYEKNRA